MLILVIPSFVMFGIEGYTRFNESGQKVAQVAGRSITQQEWDAAHRRYADNLLANSPNTDRSQLDSEQARYASLQRLLDEQLLGVAAQKLRFATSDQRLARDLQQNPTIAALRKPDGSLDMEQYRQLLASQGMTPESFGPACARTSRAARSCRAWPTPASFPLRCPRCWAMPTSSGANCSGCA